LSGERDRRDNYISGVARYTVSLITSTCKMRERRYAEVVAVKLRRRSAGAYPVVLSTISASCRTATPVCIVFVYRCEFIK